MLTQTCVHILNTLPIKVNRDIFYLEPKSRFLRRDWLLITFWKEVDMANTLPDKKPINYEFMERYTENLDLAIREYVDNRIAESGGNVNLYSKTLVAGSTSVTFEIPIGNNVIEVFNSVDGLDYISLDDSQEGIVVVTFDVQTEDVAVFLRVEPIESERQMVSQILRAGQTSITFSNIPLTDNMIEVYTSKDGLDYVTLDDSVAGRVTITYEAQSEDVTVFLKVSGTTED